MTPMLHRLRRKYQYTVDLSYKTKQNKTIFKHGCAPLINKKTLYFAIDVYTIFKTNVTVIFSALYMMTIL